MKVKCPTDQITFLLRFPLRFLRCQRALHVLHLTNETKSTTMAKNVKRKIKTKPRNFLKSSFSADFSFFTWKEELPFTAVADVVGGGIEGRERVFVDEEILVVVTGVMVAMGKAVVTGEMVAMVLYVLYLGSTMTTAWSSKILLVQRPRALCT